MYIAGESQRRGKLEISKQGPGTVLRGCGEWRGGLLAVAKVVS